MVDAAIDTLREVDVAVLVVDATLRPGAGDEFVLDLLKRAQVAGDPRAEQGRSRPQAAAAAADRALRAGARRSRRSCRSRRSTGDGVDALEREILAALPEGEPLYPDDYLTDQTRADARRRAGPREGARATRATSCRTRRRSSSTSSRSRRAAGGLTRIFASILVDQRLAEADRRRQGRRHDQAHRHRGAPAISKRCSTAGSTSTCTSRSARTGATTSACWTSSG